jgi:hypothetical protein
MIGIDDFWLSQRDVNIFTEVYLWAIDKLSYSSHESTQG